MDCVGDIFEPVMWHHQRRPFIRALTCKTIKTRRGVADGASSDDQVNPVLKEEGEEERERLVDPASNDFSLLPFISLHAICPFCPCHAHCPMGTSDIFSDLI
jgi:hypothetical protein